MEQVSGALQKKKGIQEDNKVTTKQEPREELHILEMRFDVTADSHRTDAAKRKKKMDGHVVGRSEIRNWFTAAGNGASHTKG